MSDIEEEDEQEVEVNDGLQEVEEARTKGVTDMEDKKQATPETDHVADDNSSIAT